MHQKNADEMSELEKVNIRVQSIEDSLAAKGIEVVRVPPIILGRQPRGMPVVTMTVSKSSGGARRIVLVTEGQSRDSIGIQDWAVDMTIEPGPQPMMNIDGWVELTDARLMRPQKCWAQGDVDVEGMIEQGDHVALRFNNNPNWNVQATVTSVGGRRIVFAERTPHAIPEPVRITEHNEYKKDRRLFTQPGEGAPELVPETVGLLGRTILKGWTNGRLGPNTAFNERIVIGFQTSEEYSHAPYRQISIWCSRYKNSSKDGIEMTVELPTRRA